MLLWSVIGTKFSLVSWCVDSLGDDTRSISLLNIDSRVIDWDVDDSTALVRR